MFRSPEASGGYILSTRLTRAATTGLTVETLAPGAHGRIDPAGSLTVTIDRGALVSLTPLALLAGGNTAAVEITPDTWEILQFTSATLTAPRTYRLAGLLRGLRGTEHSAIIPAGARFVLLDSAVQPVDMSSADVGLTLNWRAGPAARDIGDASYATVQQRFSGRGLAPLAPVHVRASRNSAGDVTLSWTRRTRSDGDAWDQLDVPLGETTESYAVDVLLGTTVKRTLTPSQPTTTYAVADQIADFGSAQSSITFRLAQISPTFGRGTARTLTL